MKIWLCVETVRPLRWCIRYGRKWRIVKRVKVQAPMETRAGVKSPHGYLFAIGTVIFKGPLAIIRGG